MRMIQALIISALCIVAAEVQSQSILIQSASVVDGTVRSTSRNRSGAIGSEVATVPIGVPPVAGLPS